MSRGVPRTTLVVLRQPERDVRRHAYVVFVRRSDARDDVDEAAGGAHAAVESRGGPCAAGQKRVSGGW